ncbi:Pc12g14310 [Penicillium rubens Wisconsin 54-1255]|uniref:Pc12g14310 protein n=1 Tax=Penicillium rubens (strain ATCC 28089 / DSM 1075 / NRRL 1951 / Wisconsin 54-1255) TaxID=500485 RepID=B6H0U0_PENRW|nr:Pc12g14310 [Penicillium rubens Wisconsin 54-1255]
MPRSEEAEWWANAVYEAIQEVPRGKVTSYGHIARLLGEHYLFQIVVSSQTGPYDQTRNGLLSMDAFPADNYSSGPGSAERQAEALAQEGVEVTADSMGEILGSNTLNCIRELIMIQEKAYGD